MAEQEHYLNDKGLIVFTETYHRKRGFCCGCGCLHCPYDYIAVKEPKRSELKAKRKMKKNSSFKP
jgi:hypothetical protein